MFSAGMLTALASATMVRSRGFISGSPPPLRAATVNSLMTRVNTLPRFASAAPFLCLIVCHLEWPDMAELQERQGRRGREILTEAEAVPATGGSAFGSGSGSRLQVASARFRALPSSGVVAIRLDRAGRRPEPGPAPGAWKLRARLRGHPSARSATISHTSARGSHAAPS